MILGEDLLKLLLEFVDLLHVLVLDPEVVHLRLHVIHLRLQLVLLLHRRNQHIEVILQSDDLLVDVLGNFILLRILKNHILQIPINLLHRLHDFLGLILNLVHILNDRLNVLVLQFETANNFSDALGILVAVDVFRQLSPLLLHELEDLFLVLNVRSCCLQLAFQLLDLFDLVLVFDAPIRNCLLRFENLLFYRLLVLFPLIAQLLELRVDLSHL